MQQKSWAGAWILMSLVRAMVMSCVVSAKPYQFHICDLALNKVPENQEELRSIIENKH